MTKIMNVIAMAGLSREIVFTNSAVTILPSVFSLFSMFIFLI